MTTRSVVRASPKGETATTAPPRGREADVGSPETCEKCGRVPLRLGQTSSGPRCLSCFMRGDEQHATPTPPAPADARPMVVGGAFVKFDRPAPAPDAGWEPWGNPYPRHPDVIRTRDLCLAICEKHQAFDAAAEIRVMHLPPAPDAGAAERAVGEAARESTPFDDERAWFHLRCGVAVLSDWEGNIDASVNAAALASAMRAYAIVKWGRPAPAALRGTKGGERG